jgi:hypothetical protein
MWGKNMKYLHVKLNGTLATSRFLMWHYRLSPERLGLEFLVDLVHYLKSNLCTCNTYWSRSLWQGGLRCTTEVALLLRLWVRIPRWARMSVCCECCVLSGRGVYDELITRPEEPYRMWCVNLWHLGTSRITRPWPALSHSAKGKQKYILKYTFAIIYIFQATFYSHEEITVKCFSALSHWPKRS